jgi:hypothetical protein
VKEVNTMSNQTNAVEVIGSTVRGLEKFALTPKAIAVGDVVDVLEGVGMTKLVEAVKGFVEGEKNRIQGENQILTAGVEVKAVMDQVKPLTYAWFMTVSGYWKEQYMKRTGFNSGAADTAWNRFMPAVGVERPKADGKAKEVAEKREAEAKRLQAIPDVKKAMAVAFKSGDLKELGALSKEAERRTKQAENGAVAELKPLKDQIRKALAECNNKHTLQLVLGKLQGKDVNLQSKK